MAAHFETLAAHVRKKLSALGRSPYALIERSRKTRAGPELSLFTTTQSNQTSDSDDALRPACNRARFWRDANFRQEVYGFVGVFWLWFSGRLCQHPAAIETDTG